MVLDKGKQHINTRNINQTTSWQSTDEKHLFEERFKSASNDKDLLWYIDNPISYKHNNYGFRTPVDFYDGIEGNVFLGCSHTFGLGVHLHHTWAWQLNEIVGGNFINMSVPATGIGTGARLLNAFKAMVKPKNIFMHYPHPYRFEHFDSILKRWVTISPLFQNTKATSVQKLSQNINFKTLISEINNSKTYYMSNFQWIKSLAQELNANFYHVPLIDNKKVDKYFSELKSKNYRPIKARDRHHGTPYHHSIVEMFLEQINSEPYTTVPDLMFETKWENPGARRIL